MKSHRIDKAALATVLLALFAASGSAMAQDHDTKWEKTHPRRDQVNDRLEKQNKRINHEVKEGELTKAQAHKLRAEDQQIRREEQAMASEHGGHITKQEQRKLNHQENVVSKQIGK
jgi:hypothetical protein